MSDDASIDAALRRLHADGSTIIEAIKHIRNAFGLTLGDAKEVVSSHPSYRAWAQANEPLHDAVIKALVAMAGSSSVERAATVFVLHHSHPSPSRVPTDPYDDSAKLLGVYSSLESAQRAIERLRALPGFVDWPNGFSIDPYRLDEDHWTSGFVTV